MIFDQITCHAAERILLLSESFVWVVIRYYLCETRFLYCRRPPTHRRQRRLLVALDVVCSKCHVFPPILLAPRNSWSPTAEGLQDAGHSHSINHFDSHPMNYPSWRSYRLFPPQISAFIGLLCQRVIVKRTFAKCMCYYEELKVDRFIVDWLTAAKSGSVFFVIQKRRSSENLVIVDCRQIRRWWSFHEDAFSSFCVKVTNRQTDRQTKNKGITWRT